MNRLILADNQAIFRSGAARILAMEDDMRIVAQCEDASRLMAALDHIGGVIVLFSTSMQPDIEAVLARIRETGSRAILVTENTEEVTAGVAEQLDGIICRNISGTDLIDSLRRVSRGTRYIHHPNITAMAAMDSVGARVRDQLTPKEMQIVALIVQGCKNKDIANQLNTKEQVIKNYLRSIYDKTGVSDRLELALFTLHHRVLADAAAKAGNLLQKKSA
ncbi:LuxR C-terminal-related transcriptional regulator [Granulicella arctica]|uniref:DNA-binding NarL/FixJ family response regulator n=1 Tax=Granulicella arctica TaxID=940613 RepID=A0A7Y9PIL8_9BACT|nr:response regulator transcription factor [Granulicella arctica]NYF80584.1 DNA-binding NarL/FixJ family response regulator [Granulicella arctica]